MKLSETDLTFLKRKLSFWDELSDKEQARIAENTSLVTYKQGETVYNAIQECIGVLLVKSGELRTYILSESGKEVTLYRLEPGEVCILSASCLLKNISFDVHIDAEQDSEVLLIDITTFSALMTENVIIENFSLKIAADKFSDVMWAMEQILFMSLDKRLAIFLLDESAKNHSDTINLTHEQIAKYIGSAREAVSRMMQYFAKEKCLELSRGSIKITDNAKLKRIAEVENF